MHHAAAVEGVARDAEAVCAEDVTAFVVFVATARGAETDEREIARAAAEVAYQDEFVVIELALVVIGRRNRLELEGDVLEPGGLGRGAQACEGESLVFGSFSAGEVDGSAEDDARAEVAELRACGLSQLAQDDGNEVFYRVAAAVDDGVCEEAAGEVGFD